MRLYRVYLYLIMLTEGVTRGYGDEEVAELRAWVGGHMGDELDALAG
jgi:hypothetical protein